MSPEPCDCSIIIPTRNRCAVLTDTLSRLGALTTPGIETIVLNNGSSDQTSDLARRFPRVRWIDLGANLGCAARNIGAVAARGDVLLMLDDDSYPDPGVIEYLVGQMMMRPHVGAIACRVLLAGPHQPARHDAGGVPGIFFNCGGAIRRQAFLECGGFPIDFEYYVEEYDLCCRLWKHGWGVEPHGDAIVWHGRVSGNRDNNNMLRLLVRNNLRLWDRYAPPHLRDQLISETLERYRRVAMKEDAMRGYEMGVEQGMPRLGAKSFAASALSIDEFERLMGIHEARIMLLAALRHQSLRRVGIWGRGKACEQIIDLCRELRLEVSIIYDQPAESADWRGIPLAAQHTFHADRQDALIVGTLSPGVAEDQSVGLSARFPQAHIINLSRWITISDSAASPVRPKKGYSMQETSRHLAIS